MTIIAALREFWNKSVAGTEDLCPHSPTLEHWQKDPDLAGLLHDPDAVAMLLADEQEACKKLWADVASLVMKLRE